MPTLRELLAQRRPPRPGLASRPAEGPRARALAGAGRRAPERAARSAGEDGARRSSATRSPRWPTSSSAGEILLLENVRYEPGETENDPKLAAALAALADVYVDDAFGAAHRAHASTVGAAQLMQERAAGLLLEREVSTLLELIEAPDRPLVAILGGAKVSDKIKVIERFLQVADTILIGGAMAFPFLKAQGHAVGDSLCADEDVEHAAPAAADSRSAAAKLILPVDLVVADHFGADARPEQLDGVDVPDGRMGLDIGPRTVAEYVGWIAEAGTVFWNGPMGAFELEPFAAGTRAVAEALATHAGDDRRRRRRLGRGRRRSSG